MYEREVKDYCRRAGSLLACGRAQRQRFDRLTRQSVQEYLQEVPGASWPEVEQTLGSPEEAAGAFMESLPAGAAEHWAGAHRRRRALGRRPPAPPAADGRRCLPGFHAAGGHCGVLFCDQRCGHY